MDVPMAVCITVMLGKLSHIATGDQIAPWREPLSCSMSGAVSASLALLSSRVFCSICRRLRRRMETQIGFVHESTWISMAMPPTAANATKPSDSVVRESEDIQLVIVSRRNSTPPILT